MRSMTLAATLAALVLPVSVLAERPGEAGQAAPQLEREVKDELGGRDLKNVEVAVQGSEAIALRPRAALIGPSIKRSSEHSRCKASRPWPASWSFRRVRVTPTLPKPSPRKSSGIHTTRTGTTSPGT